MGNKHYLHVSISFTRHEINAHNNTIIIITPIIGTLFPVYTTSCCLATIAAWAML